MDSDCKLARMFVVESSEAVTKGYPKLLAKISSLQESGVRMLNAVDAFDDVSGTVYHNNCCHYNSLGGKIFANYVAQHIVATLDSEPALR